LRGIITFEFCSKPQSALLLIQSIVLQLAHTPNRAAGSLLYASEAITLSRFAELKDAVENNPYLMDYDSDNDGKIKYIVFGAEVVKHESFTTFLKNLNFRNTDEHMLSSMQSLAELLGSYGI
jgi:hypothetical protein